MRVVMSLVYARRKVRRTKLRQNVKHFCFQYDSEGVAFARVELQMLYRIRYGFGMFANPLMVLVVVRRSEVSADLILTRRKGKSPVLCLHRGTERGFFVSQSGKVRLNSVGSAEAYYLNVAEQTRD